MDVVAIVGLLAVLHYFPAGCSMPQLPVFLS